VRRKEKQPPQTQEEVCILNFGSTFGAPAFGAETSLAETREAAS
jgi:hypothetical protein